MATLVDNGKSRGQSVSEDSGLDGLFAEALLPEDKPEDHHKISG